MNDKYSHNDLLHVGPDKPLGYLPIKTIELYGWDVEDIIGVLKLKGLAILTLSEEQCSVGSGAVYAYDRAALASLLTQHKTTLRRNKWPTNPDAFVLAHIILSAKSNTLMFDVIADAYADYSNPGRKKRR